MVVLSIGLAGQTRAQDDVPVADVAVASDETEAAPELDSGDTAWMLVSSALVLMMTCPGLALFYGGLVCKKNIVSVLMQCAFLMGLMSGVWGLWGYGDAVLRSVEAIPTTAASQSTLHSAVSFLIWRMAKSWFRKAERSRILCS